MKVKVRVVLDVVDMALSTWSADESRELWDVLTALRGPDETQTYGLKVQLTSPIRAAVFPRLWAQAQGNDGYTPFGAEFREPDGLAAREALRRHVAANTGAVMCPPRVGQPGGVGHFAAHVLYAMRVLGWWDSDEQDLDPARDDR